MRGKEEQQNGSRDRSDMGPQDTEWGRPPGAGQARTWAVPESPPKGANPAGSCKTSDFQNRERMNLCHFSRSIYEHLFR